MTTTKILVVLMSIGKLSSQSKYHGRTTLVGYYIFERSLDNPQILWFGLWRHSRTTPTTRRRARRHRGHARELRRAADTAPASRKHRFVYPGHPVVFLCSKLRSACHHNVACAMGANESRMRASSAKLTCEPRVRLGHGPAQPRLAHAGRYHAPGTVALLLESPRD
jgi:hypothetical protein